MAVAGGGESMTALSKIVAYVRQDHVDKVLMSIVIRIRPCFDIRQGLAFFYFKRFFMFQ